MDILTGQTAQFVEFMSVEVSQYLLNLFMLVDLINFFFVFGLIIHPCLFFGIRVVHVTDPHFMLLIIILLSRNAPT